MLSSGGKFRDAFDMERESPAMRDRYGRHAFGQSLLLARRLGDAGGPTVVGHKGNLNNWENDGGQHQAQKTSAPPPPQPGVRAHGPDWLGRGVAGRPSTFAEVERDVIRERVQAGVINARGRRTATRAAANSFGETPKKFPNEGATTGPPQEATRTSS